MFGYGSLYIGIACVSICLIIPKLVWNIMLNVNRQIFSND